MPKFFESISLGLRVTDMAYKDPFSETTVRVRKKLIFLSSLAILNHFFPIDLSKSHLFGVHFEDVAPTLAGLLGIVVLYFTAVFFVYVVQEIKAWLSQLEETKFKEHHSQLDKIITRHTQAYQAVQQANARLRECTDQFAVLNKHGSTISPKDVQGVVKELDRRSVNFEKECGSLTSLNSRFEDEFKIAEKSLRKSESDYGTAMWMQLIKVGVLEVMLPFFFAFWSILLSAWHALGMAEIIFK